MFGIISTIPNTDSTTPWRNSSLPARELKLRELIKDRRVLIGDVWQYSYAVHGHQVNARAVVIAFGMGSFGETVDVDVTSIASRTSGQSLMPSTSSLQYAVLDIGGPTALQNEILKHHDYDAAYPKPFQTWQLFECFRQGRRLGTLKDLRQALFDCRTRRDPAILQRIATQEALHRDKERDTREKKKEIARAKRLNSENMEVDTPIDLPQSSSRPVTTADIVGLAQFSDPITPTKAAATTGFPKTQSSMAFHNAPKNLIVACRDGGEVLINVGLSEMRKELNETKRQRDIGFAIARKLYQLLGQSLGHHSNDVSKHCVEKLKAMAERFGGKAWEEVTSEEGGHLAMALGNDAEKGTEKTEEMQHVTENRMTPIRTHMEIASRRGEFEALACEGLARLQEEQDAKVQAQLAKDVGRDNLEGGKAFDDESDAMHDD